MCVTKDGFMSLKTTKAIIVAKWSRQLSVDRYKPEFKNLNDYFVLIKGQKTFILVTVSTNLTVWNLV